MQISLENIIKKILNKNLYNKSIIKTSLKNSKGLIDNYQNSKMSVLPSFPKTIDGSSINTRNFLYKNKLNPDIQFNHEVSFFNPDNYQSSFQNTFSRSIECLGNKSLTKNFRTLIFLNPVKGGFICYSTGTLGFLPKSHAEVVISKVTKNLINTYKENKFISINIFRVFHRNVFKTPEFVFRIPFLFATLSLLPKKTTTLSTKKKHNRNAFSNFVFLTQSDEKDPNLNESPANLTKTQKSIQPKFNLNKSYIRKNDFSGSRAKR